MTTSWDFRGTGTRIPPDEFVGHRIKELKTTITGLKTEDNTWTQTLDTLLKE
jgi:hypothetical protein